MLNTPLKQLRKNAPGSLTAERVAELMRKRGLERIGSTVNAFERGQLQSPAPRFVELYAEIIGQSVKTVRLALARTHRLRKRAAASD